MSWGWNVGLALPEWILAGAALLALWHDARTPPDRKDGVMRRVWWGTVLALIVVAFQGLALPGEDEIAGRVELFTAFDAAPGDRGAYDALADAGAPVAAFDDYAGDDRPAGAWRPLEQWTAGKSLGFLGHYGLDAFSIAFKLIFGLTALFVFVMAGAWLRRVDRGHGEFALLCMFATLGMFFVSSVEDFAGLFVGLELITVSFYCLTAFKRNDERSIEASVKYIVLGAVASAFLLLGIAFLYGATGSLLFADLASASSAQQLGHSGGALIQFGLLLTLVGLGFKIAAVPFHVWTPDVYEGASSPVTAFLSMGSKAAGFVLLLKVIRACLGPEADAGLATAMPWIVLLGLIAAVTILYGNLGAMWQGNMKRLLGYSSIGHAGYVLMGVLAFDEAGFSAVLYYLMAYLFTVLGVFGVVVVVNGALKSHEIDDYSGLGRRAPFLAFVLTVGLLSLAGVPPLAGFFGKFLVFRALIGTGTWVAYTVAFVGAAGVVISLYYYLCVVKRLYMHELPEGAPDTDIPVGRPLRLVLWICLAGMFVLGLGQQPFLALAEQAAAALAAAR